MRRGHPGIGRWRNENPRYFAPRGGGTPHFRPSRGFGILGPSRYPLLGPRPRIYRPFISHQGSIESHISLDRNDYRSGSHQNNQHKPHEGSQQYGRRQIFQTSQHRRHVDTPSQNNQHKDIPNYYDEDMPSKQCHVNRLGDIDDRQSVIIPQTHESLKQRQFPWATRPPFFENHSHNKSYRQLDNNELNKTTLQDYAGHRPPSSDHYGGNLVSAIDNSNAFSHSVDDTVNIVKKRLLSRGSQHSESPPRDQNDAENPERDTDYSNVQQEPLMKRKTQKQNVNINCEKIKNRIVHQLFMMDKDKIHKLMDNPHSSTKFEYAISSLITESQNSYNRHLRSVAEKSLCSSSTEFIHNDNNTIYEDTFMKQMQCILDPQDTVMLEDIKPMVLAELNKVLQLSDFDQMVDDHTTYSGNELSYYGQHSTDTQSYEDYPDVDYDIPYVQNPPESDYKRSEDPIFNNEENRSRINEEVENFAADVDVLFERRPVQKNVEERNTRRSSESEKRRSERRSIDNQSSKDKYTRSQTPIPCFDANAEHLSDEDDPFAELDKQYHVAVDHNFIEIDDLSCLQQPVVSKIPEQPIIKKEIVNMHTPQVKSSNIKVSDNQSFITPEKTSYNIKQEIDGQLQDLVKSPLKFGIPVHNISKHESNETSSQQYKEKVEHKVMRDVSLHFTTPTKQGDSNESKSLDNLNLTHEQHQPCYPKIVDDSKEKLDDSGITIKTSSTSSHTRKRSVDQRPSHRKEKRKKSESSQPDTNKQILNKNIIINVSDCMKSSQKCDSPKSVFNLFFAKNKETSKESKKNDSTEKGNSDKYIARKETPKKIKDKEGDSKRQQDSSLSSHSIQSPTNSSSTGTGIQSSTKVEGKTKLKPIDMFFDLPRKANVHQAHRNTAIAPSTNKTPIEVKCEALVVPVGRKVTRRHIGTQVLRKYRTKETQTLERSSSSSRFVQTERKKTFTRGSQTEPVAFKSDLKPKNKPSDIFERMKEIDMEIQVLLQEKFKLYNSLESKESCPNTMKSLGMAVLNVTPLKDIKEEEENIVSDDVTEEYPSIPGESLDLDFENVKEHNLPMEKSRRCPKMLRDRKSSESSITIITSTKSKKKSNTPNISLIEKIISDDRPLEDIISLQDLESPPVKSKRKHQKSKVKPKKKVAMKVKTVKPISTNVYTDLMKECRVVLVREDISKYLEAKSKEITNVIEVSDVEQEASIVEETSVNDIQLDMLDVSEDIIIGNVCEVKCGEKDVDDSSNMSICEEIILDNSQSSVEDTVGTGASLFNISECKMYDYSVDDSLRRDSITVTGNGDAVLAMECVENNFLAACLDGNVYYFSGDGQLIITLRGSNLAVTCLTVVQDKYGTTVYTGSLDSRIRYYDLETALEKGPECNVLSPIQTMDRAWDTIFVGTRTGFVLQFECKNNLLIPVSTVKFSEQSILALRALKEGPRKVLLVAARSESVTIKDAQSGLLLRTLEGPKMTVYTLLFEDGKVYCGTSGHQIQVFDYASGSHVCAHEGGKGAVCLRAAGGLVFAGCYDGCVYVYREGEPRALAQLRGPSLMLLSLAIAGTKIIAGYKDRSLYIWKIPLGILQDMVL